MSHELHPLIPEYVLGTLPAEDARRIEAQLASEPTLAQEIDRVIDGFARAADALVPIQPSPAVRARLMSSLGGVDRFAPFLARIAQVLDLPAQAVRKLLAQIDDPQAWEPGLPGMHMQHFQAGPRFATADAGFVRLQPGIAFPRHRHLGPEVTVVLEGAMRDGDRIHGPGQVVELAEGTVHDYVATSDRELVILTVHNGIVPVF